MFGSGEIVDERYKTIEPIGRGGMGVVYLATDIERDEQVALKVLMLPPGESHVRFRREFRVMSRLEHPNIVRVIASGSYDALPYLVMTHVTGGTLQERFAGGAQDRHDLVKRLDLALQITDALHYIHALGIVHRDLKPDNVMLEAVGDEHARALLMDFGLAKSEHQDSVIASEHGMVIGTASYMSPEQIQGRSVDARSDLYAFGCLLYWLLTGQPPFQGDSVALTMVQQLQNTPAPPSHHNPLVDHDLDTIVLTLLAKEPGERYSTASDVATQLRTYFDTLADRSDPYDQPLPDKPLPDKIVPTAIKRLLQAPLIGREKVWQQLYRALHSLHERHGKVISLEAEAGLGLSRMLKETWREANAQNILTLHINHREGVAIPYQAWRQSLLRFKRRYPDAFANASDGLHAALAPLLSEHSAAVDDPLPSQKRAAAPLSASGVQLRLYDALDRLLARLARVLPLTVLVDNVHVAGQESLGLLAYLVRGSVGQQALFVIGSHTEQTDTSVARTLHSFDADRVHLKPLSRDAMRRLLAALLGDELEPSLERYVCERAGGNPFFAEELLLALLGDERIVRRDGVWSWQGDPGGVPQRLEDVFQKRLEPLSDFAVHTLRVASSIGRSFDFGLLKTLLGCDENSLLDATEALLRSNLIDERSAERYHFSHVLLRETLHHQLPLEKRQQYHEQIAEQLRRRADTPPEQIAEHYAETERPERAFHHALVAARNAEAIFANSIAEHYYRLALEVGPPDESDEDARQTLLATARFELGVILERVGQWDDAEALYLQLVQIDGQEVEALHRLGGLAQRRGDLGPSREYLEQALALAPQDPRIHSTLGRTLTLMSELESAQDVLEKGLALAAEQDDLLLVQAHIDLAELDYHRSRWQAAIERLDVAAAFCQGDDAIALRAKIDNVAGSAHRKLGHFDQASHHLSAAYERYQTIGEVERALGVLQNLSNIYADSGDHQRALRTDEEARRKAKRLGADKHQAISAANLGEEHLRLGNYSDARAFLNEACDLFARTKLVHYEVYTRLNLAACYARNEQIGVATEQLGIVAARLEAAPQSYYQALYHLRCGEVDLRAGAAQKALVPLRQALDTFLDIQSRADILEAYLLKAEALLSLGHHERCRHVLEAARKHNRAHDDLLIRLQIDYLHALSDDDSRNVRRAARELRAHAFNHTVTLTQRSLHLRPPQS